ncbi:MAG: hypothetical protein OXU53_08950 [Deltaproteobacteria bacterium]|nr:hypothetical protein [Deltaproteobacteria bacterium]
MNFRDNDDVRRAAKQAVARIGKASWRTTEWTAKTVWKGTKRTAAFWGRRHPALKAVVYVGGAFVSAAGTAYAGSKSATEAAAAGGSVILTAGAVMAANKFCSWAAKSEKVERQLQEAS